MSHVNNTNINVTNVNIQNVATMDRAEGRRSIGCDASQGQDPLGFGLQMAFGLSGLGGIGGLMGAVGKVCGLFG